MLPDFGAKHALLLQGPMSFFFRWFAEELEDAGIAVTKVNFNGGDRLFYARRDAIDYRGTPDEWPAFLERLVRDRGVDACFLFGDGRPIHRAAIAVLRRLDVPVYVFEEGYLRPDFITLEAGGVNGYSSLPRDPAFYRAVATRLPKAPHIEPVGPTFGRAAWAATFYVIAMALDRRRFPAYVHHRPLTPFGETRHWLTSLARKIVFERLERDVLPTLSGPLSKRYFFVPLQARWDHQITHSPYPSVEAALRAIVADFAANAPKDVHLVLKHHPMDRAYGDYTRVVAELRRAHGLGERLRYVHDLHLPTLLRNARGVVTVNSTVGLQGLSYGTPVKVLGTAVYDLPGLTYRGTLAEFWRDPGRVDKSLYDAFRAWLLYANQANGSFHRRFPGTRRGTGVRWFPGSPQKWPTAARAKRRGD